MIINNKIGLLHQTISEYSRPSSSLRNFHPHTRPKLLGAKVAGNVEMIVEIISCILGAINKSILRFLIDGLIYCLKQICGRVDRNKKSRTKLY